MMPLGGAFHLRPGGVLQAAYHGDRTAAPDERLTDGRISLEEAATR